MEAYLLAKTDNLIYSCTSPSRRDNEPSQQGHLTSPNLARMTSIKARSFLSETAPTPLDQGSALSRLYRTHLAASQKARLQGKGVGDDASVGNT